MNEGAVCVKKHPRTCAVLPAQVQEHQSLLAMPEPREDVRRARNLPPVTLQTSRQMIRFKSKRTKRASFMIKTTSFVALTRPKSG
jgi:hypothetical protein